MILKSFGVAFGITIVGLALGFVYGGLVGLSVVAILGILEISLSFDNAVVNAAVLGRMSAYWQRIFLTVGLIIAVFGMRLLFPLVLVGVAAHLSPVEAVKLAAANGDPSTPGSYAYILASVHPAIAAFGGMFLFLLFLEFLTDDRDVVWIRWIERPFTRLGRIPSAPVVIALVVLIVFAQFVAPENERATIYLAGLIGIVVHILVSTIGKLIERGAGSPSSGAGRSTAVVAGKAAFFLFLYLEVLDASFSFDGVIGAFAITADPILIALGLGIGAIYIRSLTIFLVHRGTLQNFRYLENGALWAIGALSVVLLFSIRWDIPQLVTGLIGVVFIGAGLISSVLHNRRERRASGES